MIFCCQIWSVGGREEILPQRKICHRDHKEHKEPSLIFFVIFAFFAVENSCYSPTDGERFYRSGLQRLRERFGFMDGAGVTIGAVVHNGRGNS